MNWLNLNLELFRDDRFMDADPLDRATWLLMVAHCCLVENGGVMRDAHKWNNERWLRTVGVTREEYERPCGLWKNEVGHVRVWGYPIKQEQKYKQLRKRGQRGAEKRWGNKVIPMDQECQEG
jgi:hypothetical protein